MTKFHLSFHGSRSLKDERVRIIILEAITLHEPTTIVTHAEPGGVCGLVRDICKEQAIPLKLHFLNFKYLRGAFEYRSKAVLNDSDYSIFIHDGVSKGCSNELKLAKKMKLKYSYCKLEPAKYESSVGFDPTVPWDEVDFNMDMQELGE